MKQLHFVASVALVVSAAAAGRVAAAPAAKDKSAAKVEPANTLSKAEKAAGWQLLFDGKSATGWRGFKSDKFPDKGWVAEAGEFKSVAGAKGGDIVTLEQYDNYELRLDWMVLPGGNSGVKYLVDESLVKGGHSGLGFEMQVLDDERHPDATKGKDGTHKAGALYDLIGPSKNVVKPAGQWNQARLIVDGNHIEHWLNGSKVVEYERASPALKALIAESKYKTNPGFGEAAKGYILLQEHGDEAHFRNIKLRKLPAKKAP
jgi:hypothetical protein